MSKYKSRTTSTRAVLNTQGHSQALSIQIGPIHQSQTFNRNEFTPKMSDQIQNFSTLNPFDDKIIDEPTSVASGKAVPSKIRKYPSHKIPFHSFSNLNDDNFPIYR